MEKKKLEKEILEYVKEGQVEDKVFFIFLTSTGEYRAVEAEKLPFSNINPGQKFNALVKPRGCSGREIVEIYAS